MLFNQERKVPVQPLLKMSKGIQKILSESGPKWFNCIDLNAWFAVSKAVAKFKQSNRGSTDWKLNNTIWQDLWFHIKAYETNAAPVTRSEIFEPVHRAHIHKHCLSFVI